MLLEIDVPHIKINFVAAKGIRHCDSSSHPYRNLWWIVHAGNMQKPSSGKVLLSGASGMIGGAIRSELSSRQMQMLQLSRSSVDPNRANAAGGPDGTAKGAAGSRNLQYVAVSISGEIPWNPTTMPAVA